MIRIFLLYLTMLFGSIGIEFLYRYLRRLIISSYTYAKEK